MDTLGGKGIAGTKARSGADINKYPKDGSAPQVLKKGTVTDAGNFGGIPVSDNSAQHPYGAH